MRDELISEIVKRVVKEMSVVSGEEVSEKIKSTEMTEGRIPIEVSARHVHFSEEDYKALFGIEAVMTKKKELSQYGQFQCEERVMLIGPKGTISRVAVLGPFRQKTQIEITKTDARQLGVNAPLNQSGNLEGASGVHIASGNVVIEIKSCVIIAKNHIHMNTLDARNLDVVDNQTVSVRIKSERPITFEDVLVRVSDKYSLAMHIDFDEANAAWYCEGDYGEIVNSKLVDSSQTCKQQENESKVEKMRYVEETSKISDELLKRKLIVEDDIKKIAKDGIDSIYVHKKSIITPLAKDAIRQERIKVLQKISLSS
ncbi:MAG: phosphate propanoyltransferase [Alkaliphilus sp.]